MLATGVCRAEALAAVGDTTLASALAWGEIILEERNVRLVLVPTVVGECWGPVSSCPDMQLYIAYNSGDLYEKLHVYEMPIAKGWKFAGWVGPATFVLDTALPEANIDPADRGKWRKQSFRISITETGVQFERM